MFGNEDDVNQNPPAVLDLKGISGKCKLEGFNNKVTLPSGFNFTIPPSPQGDLYGEITVPEAAGHLIQAKGGHFDEAVITTFKTEGKNVAKGKTYTFHNVDIELSIETGDYGSATGSLVVHDKVEYRDETTKDTKTYELKEVKVVTAPKKPV